LDWRLALGEVSMNLRREVADKASREELYSAVRTEMSTLEQQLAVSVLTEIIFCTHFFALCVNNRVSPEFCSRHRAQIIIHIAKLSVSSRSGLLISAAHSEGRGRRSVCRGHH